MRLVRSRQLILLLLLVAATVSFSCRRNPPPPPVADAPPPPPTPPPPAPTITLTANPATITAGQSTTLTWQATNATTVTLDQGLGNVAASGTRQVSPNASVTYNATATGPGGKASVPARVTVNAAPAPPPPTTGGKVAPPPPPPAADPLDVQFERLLGNQPILFDYDSSSIRSSEVSKLQGHAAFLQKNPGLRFTIEGHADERGSQEYNVGLADERAASVMKFLADQGIAANRMTTISYGEERPVCTTPDEACYQRNRRAAFVLAR
jgi:peptidoglycan-associated lipoprotein